MSDPDDELIEKLKELKNKKDALEERLNYLEAREDVLKASLLNPIIESRWVSTENKDHPGRSHRSSRSSSGNRKQNTLQISLTTVLLWAKKKEKRAAVEKQLEESLNKAITWASFTYPEEEDQIMRKLLGQSLLSTLDWVKNLDTKEKEEYFKQQLIDSLKVAIDWTSKIGEDDELMVQTLADYIVIASNWAKIVEENYREEKDETKEDNTVEEKDNTEAEYDEIEEKAARQELQQCLKDIFDWINSINPKPIERSMQYELLDSLIITSHWVKTGAASRDDEVMKQLIQETLLISLNWVISVDEEEGEEMRQQLIDSLIFAINWATSDETRGDDEVMRTLLRQLLKTATEWKNKIDHETGNG